MSYVYAHSPGILTPGQASIDSVDVRVYNLSNINNSPIRFRSFALMGVSFSQSCIDAASYNFVVHTAMRKSESKNSDLSLLIRNSLTEDRYQIDTIFYHVQNCVAVAAISSWMYNAKFRSSVDGEPMAIFSPGEPLYLCSFIQNNGGVNSTAVNHRIYLVLDYILL